MPDTFFDLNPELTAGDLLPALQEHGVRLRPVLEHDSDKASEAREINRSQDFARLVSNRWRQD